MERVIQVSGVSKSFPGVQALDAVDFDLKPGEVHALLGENGAGKSTLMKILAGLDRPDAGEIRFRGRPVRFRDPHDALALGIAMIHQELMPFPALSVAENIFIGREPASGIPGWIDRETMHRDAAEVLGRLGIELDPGGRMGALSVAEKQSVEIARALARDAEVLIMDEPTSALSDTEIHRLFGILEELKGKGTAIIYISHKLDEVFRVADRVTVFRDGRHIATRETAAFDRERLIALMVGRPLGPAQGRASRPGGAVALSLRGFSRSGMFEDVALDVRHGEILGIAGLMGAGRTELMNAIYGLAPPHRGTLAIHGRPVRVASPRDAIANGIAMVTEDRVESGLVPRMSVAHNLTLSTLRSWCRGGLIDPARERDAVASSVARFRIKTAGTTGPVAGLSGGNQQKVLLARALLTQPDILILDEPTRGIDVGAKEEIYALINGLAAAGKAILLVSSELPEILSLCDRILVLRQGRVAAELTAAASQEEILHHAMPA